MSETIRRSSSAVTTAWRIVKTRRATGIATFHGVDLPKPFDGEGARRYPGRWNSVGTPIVYTAESQSLAALEILVHVDRTALLASYSAISVTFPDTVVQQVALVPDDWALKPIGTSSRALGDAWVVSQSSLVLAVPSVVVPNETNFLINPNHPDVALLKFGAVEPFLFDPRLSS